MDIRPHTQDGRKAYVSNAKAIKYILSGFLDSIFVKVMQCKSNKEMRDKLVRNYEWDDKVKKENL